MAATAGWARRTALANRRTRLSVLRRTDFCVYNAFNGALASTCLDFDLHVHRGVRSLSAALLARVCLGEGMDSVMREPSDQRELLARLKPAGQEHLLRFWDELDAAGRQRLGSQIAAIDLAQISRLHQQGVGSKDCTRTARRSISPSTVRLADRQNCGRWSSEDARKCGAGGLRHGRIGVLVVAGGQGSRLGFDHPKGMYPIGPVSGASLL